MLALLLLFHHVLAKVPDNKTEVHVVKKIDSCPDVGYFFQRDVKPNAITPSCHLCFCEEHGTSVCWPRRNNRCDIKSYQHRGREARDKRRRRSPGFADIFLRDATRDVFDKNTAEECKPFESSTSEGCPPADWCIGCTVCDCDANGRWDCHVLSFCPDDKGKKKMKKRRGSLKNNIVKRQLQKKKPVLKTTKKPYKKPSAEKPKKQSYKGKKPQQKFNKLKKPIVHGNNNKGKTKKTAPVKKTRPIYKKKIQAKNKGKSNQKVIKKPTRTPPFQNKKGKAKLLDATDGAVKNIAETILKKVMASVEKIVSDTHKTFNKSVNGKFIQKRSMPKHYRISKKGENKYNTKKKSNKVMKSNHNASLRKNSRSKRDVSNLMRIQNSEKNDNISTTLDTTKLGKSLVTSSIENNVKNSLILMTPISKKITKSDYFLYNVESEIKNVTRNDIISIKNDNYTFLDESVNITYKPNLKKVNDLKFSKFNESYNISKHTPKVILFLKSKKNSTGNQTGTSLKLSNKIFVNRKFYRNVIKDKTKNDSEIIRKKLTCGRLCNITNIFSKLFTYGERNSTKRIKSKASQFGVLKYLRNIFGKVFINKVKRKKSTKNLKRTINRRDVIKTLCKNLSGSCKMDVTRATNKILLGKVDQLILESNKILKSIKIIKGLLRLLVKDRQNIKYNSTSTTKQFSHNDIAILNEIIRGNNGDKYNLTDTQRIQITYLKDNTKVFLVSVEKFSYILKNVIKILINSNEKNYKIKRRNFKCTKNQIINNVNANETVEEKLNKIKKILLNYNLVQNKFMKNMYDMLITLTPYPNMTTERGQLLEVSSKTKNNNNAYAIEKYTKDIIQSLRKLKNLAQKLSFKNRRKRAVMEDDDAIEYLLMIMEYLLKQNKPLDVSPVNDGIDLLIDAIKNAPDIKPIKKKVLEYAPIQLNKHKNFTSNIATGSFRTFKPIDEDREGSNIYYNNENSDNNKSFKPEYNDNQIVKQDNNFNSTLTAKTDVQDNEFEKLNIDKVENKEDGRRYDIFNDDLEGEESIYSTSTRLSDVFGDGFTTTIFNIPIRTTTVPSLKLFQDYDKDDQVFDALNDTFLDKNKNTKLEWVEEIPNANIERKELLTTVDTTTQAVTKAVTRTVRKTAAEFDKYIDPISSISRETIDEEKTKNIDPEYVVSQKQMNLLNSLDYGTEKADTELNSKEEKYNAESFPLYFV